MTASLVVMFHLVRKGFRTYGSQVAAAPVDKKFRVKITSNCGEKLEFASLHEEDVKRVIEIIIALKQEKKK